MRVQDRVRERIEMLDYGVQISHFRGVKGDTLGLRFVCIAGAASAGVLDIWMECVR